MPIKGLADRVRLPRLGVFKLGIKHTRPDGKPAGATNLPYFVVPEDVKKITGPKPVSVRICFPSMNAALLFPYHMNKWVTGGMLVLRCDGETAREFAREGGEKFYPCKWVNRDQKCPCGANAEGRLSFMVLDEQDLPHGPYQVRIKGAQRVADVVGFITFYAGVLGPRFLETPFKLERVPTAITYQDTKGVRHSTTDYPPTLMAYDDLKLPRALPPGLEPKALGDGQSHDEQDDDDTDETDEAAETEDAEARRVGDDFKARQDAKAAEPAEYTDVSQARELPPEEWTHEKVGALAKKIGCGWDTFSRYVTVRFGGKHFDDLEAGPLRLLGEEMELANAQGEAARVKFKTAMFETLKAAAQRR